MDSPNQLAGEKVFCRYKTFGCRQSMEIAELEEHEDICGFMPIKCPMSKGQCRWIGYMLALRDHLMEVHGLEWAYGCNIDLRRTLKNKLPYEYSIILRYTGRDFILMVEKQIVTEEEDKEEIYLSLTTIMIGFKKEAKEYLFQATLEGKENKSIWCNIPKSVDEYYYDDRSFRVPMRIAFLFAVDGDLMFTYRLLRNNLDT